MATDIKALANQIADNFLKSLGAAAKNLTNKDRELIALSANDAAELQVKALLGKDLSQEIRIVNATLLNLSAAKTIAVQRVFWLSVESAAKTAISAGIRIALASLTV